MLISLALWAFVRCLLDLLFASFAGFRHGRGNRLDLTAERNERKDEIAGTPSAGLKEGRFLNRPSSENSFELEVAVLNYSENIAEWIEDRRNLDPFADLLDSGS